MKNNLFSFLASFFAAIIVCATAIASVYLFPLQQPNISKISMEFAFNKKDDACEVMADEFAQVIGYKTFDDFILNTRIIIDKSIVDKPAYEKVQAVAKLLDYSSFEKLYFETNKVFNIKHPAKNLINNQKVYALEGESVFHSEYCETLAKKSGKISSFPSREEALKMGLTPCTDCLMQ